jgi:hypothetical protein
LATECGLNQDIIVRVAAALAPWRTRRRHCSYRWKNRYTIENAGYPSSTHCSFSLIKLSEEGAVAAFFPSYKCAQSIVEEIKK